MLTRLRWETPEQPDLQYTTLHYTLYTPLLILRWETPEQPDPDGVQKRAIREMLADRPDIKFVWMDYPCMPQVVSK